MRLIVYAFIFAVVFLILKAFFLDDYIAEYKGGEANTSAETNVSVEPTPQPVAPEPLPPQEAEPKTPEYKKMPLDKLGDDISKHIKL